MKYHAFSIAGTIAAAGLLIKRLSEAARGREPAESREALARFEGEGGATAPIRQNKPIDDASKSSIAP